MANSAEAASIKLAREMLGWKSLTLKVRTTWTGLPDKNHMIQDYIETASGQRFFDFKVYNTKIPDSREVAWCDGKNCAYLAHEGKMGEPLRQRNAIFGTIFMHEKGWGCTSRPLPLQLLYVNHVPLHEALAKAVPLGSATSLGRPCDMFLFPQTLWGYVAQDLVFYLDHATGVPLRLEHFTDANAREQGRANGYWQALSLDEVQGFHLPFKSERAVFLPDKKGVLVKVPETELATVESLKYDVEYPKTTFWPGPFERGVKVADFLAKPYKFYTVGGTETVAAAVPHPLRAEAPSGSTAPLAWGAVVLGVSILAVAFIKMRRRR